VDPRAVRQRRQVDLAGAVVLAGAVGGQHDDELFDAQLPHRARPAAGPRAERDVGLARGHRLPQLVGVPELDQPDVDLGPVAPPHAQGGRQHAEAHRVHRGDLQLARRGAGGKAGRAARAFGVGQRRPRVRQHRPAHRREPDGPRQPLQQRATEVALECPHLV